MTDIRGCNVCVVGGAGFLGSHLVGHLIEDRKCQVLVVDNLASGYRKFVHSQATFEYADITGSENYLTELFKKYCIKYLFNYAAYPYIPLSFERPVHTFNVNAFGALKVINAAQEAGVKRILQVSSAEIYGDHECNNGVVEFRRGQVDENAAVVPHSSYGAAKAAIDAIVQVRWREAKTPVIALRQFNCIGERETHPYVVPEIISQIYNKGKSFSNYNPVPIKLGNNSARDFQYAGDAVRMAVELLEKGKLGQVYNMGSEEPTKIYGLAMRIGIIMNQCILVSVEESRKRPWEIWHLQSDNTKLYNTIQGRPAVSLEEALTRTITYFEENGHKWDWE